MADFGLYSALRGTDNWAQRRQDKAMNLAMVEQMKNDEQAKVQQSIKAEEDINKYFDEITQLQSEYLPEDAERIKQLEKSARENIIKGVTAFNGDLTRYVSSGGITDLHTYKNSILQSKEVRNAQLNKVNFGALMKDFQDGNKYIKDVEVKIPLTDENGERKVDEKGNPLLEVKKVSGEEAIKLFRDKKIDFLPYNGSEEVIKLNPLTFSQYFKDPKNPASKDNVVTGATIHSWAINNGKSEEYANKLVKSYYNMLDNGGETWKFKALSDEELALMEAKKAKLSGGSGGGGGQQVLNQLVPALQRLGTKGSANSLVMGNSDTKYFQENLGLKFDGNTNQIIPTKPLVGIDAQDPNKQFDLSNALSINFNGKYVGKPNSKGIPERYIEATVYYNSDEPGLNNPHTEGGVFQDDDLVDDNLRHNWKKKSIGETGLKNDSVDDVWQGTVLIPIETILNTPTSRDELNLERNIRSNMQAAAANVGDSDYINYINQISQQFGVTPEEAIQIFNEESQQ